MAPEYFFWTQKGTEQDYNIAVSFSAPSHAGANDGTARRKPALFLLPLRRSLSQRWPMLALNLKNIIARTNNRHFQALTASLSTRGLHGMSESGQPGPVQLSIQKKLTDLLGPTELSITNDSSQHRHHAAMRAQGGGSGETHFTVKVVSEQFAGMTTMQRHRMIYAALSDELSQGLHALSLQTKTPEEVQI